MQVFFPLIGNNPTVIVSTRRYHYENDTPVMKAPTPSTNL